MSRLLSHYQTTLKSYVKVDPCLRHAREGVRRPTL
jgi:hypothetical protein